ncbi:WD40-repeat-containing domain protein [Russula vinacea]|nr:WD40-repeat-containing domain protein [Russula vinacea]
MDGSTSPSIPVMFTTKTPYQLPPQKFMIPASWRPERQEETLEVEYIESVMPPTKLAALPHEEWVSSISCSVPGHFITGSYDGALRVFDRGQTLFHTAPFHAAPITSFAIVPSQQAAPTDDDDDRLLVVTASHDRTAQISRVSLDGTRTASMPLATLHLHDAPVADVASSQDGKNILTAGWDGLIGLWSAEIPEKTRSRSRRRSRRRNAKSGGSAKRRGSVKTKAPSACCARIRRVWNAVSCGFDSTVRTWDVERGLCSHTITVSEKPFLALALPSTPETALAASADRSVTLYDLRTGTSAAASVKFPHPATPATLVFAQSSATQFASGSYDGVVKSGTARVWDGQKGVMAVAGEGGVEVWRAGAGVEGGLQKETSSTTEK